MPPRARSGDEVTFDITPSCRRLQLFIFFMHARGVRRWRNAPLLLQIDDAAGFHPRNGDVFHELLETIFTGLDGNSPGRLHDAGKHHVITTLPVVIEQFADNESLVVEIADAVTVLKREQWLVRAVECSEFGTVFFRNRLVVPSAGRGADLLALQI